MNICFPNENLNYISNTLQNTFPVTSYILNSTYSYFTTNPIEPDIKIYNFFTKNKTQNNFDLASINSFDGEFDVTKNIDFIKKYYFNINIKNYEIYTLIIL